MSEFRDNAVEARERDEAPFDAAEASKPQSALAATARNEYLAPSSHSRNNNHFCTGYPLGAGSRILLVLWSLFLCAGFALAASLDPDSRGFGTHQRLGFPPCTFQVVFDIPCPSCGMTTSFAHFVRGEITSSARANIAGLMLAVTCFVQIPWCWLSAAQGRLWRVHNPVNLALLVVGGISAVAVVNWCLKIF